jgi:hypothetical protein
MEVMDNSRNRNESSATILFDDGLVSLTEHDLTLRIYWFPFGNSKVIPLSAIKSVRACRPRPILGIKGWGMAADAHVWWQCDLS